MERKRRLKKKTSPKKSAPNIAWHLGTSSQTVAFQNIVLMRTTKQQGKRVSTKTLCVHKSGKVKKPTSVKPPLKGYEWHFINSRKLIYKVISRVKLHKFGERISLRRTR